MWHDVDGGTVDDSGPLGKDALPESLFVYLVDVNGDVVDKTTILNNTYTLKARPNTTYSVILTMDDLLIGDGGLFGSTLPPYWEHTAAENVTDNGVFGSGSGIASAIMLDAPQIVNFGIRVINDGIVKNVFYLDRAVDISNIEEYYNGFGVSLVTIKEDIERAIVGGVALPIGEFIVNLSIRYLRMGIEVSDEIIVNCGISGSNMENIWGAIENWLEANELNGIGYNTSYDILDYANQTYILIQA